MCGIFRQNVHLVYFTAVGAYAFNIVFYVLPLYLKLWVAVTINQYRSFVLGRAVTNKCVTMNSRNHRFSPRNCKHDRSLYLNLTLANLENPDLTTLAPSPAVLFPLLFAVSRPW